MWFLLGAMVAQASGEQPFQSPAAPRRLLIAPTNFFFFFFGVSVLPVNAGGGRVYKAAGSLQQVVYPSRNTPILEPRPRYRGGEAAPPKSPVRSHAAVSLPVVSHKSMAVSQPAAPLARVRRGET